MKRNTFILIGVILSIILLAIWIYILFFSNGKQTENFATFPEGNTEEINHPAPENPLVDVQTVNKLRQLTTSPVAGFEEIVKEDGSLEVYWVELGSGNINSINLSTGEESEISVTTMPNTTNAILSRDGNYVYLQQGYNNKSKHTVFTIDNANNSLSNSWEINNNTTNVTYSSDDLFLYTEQIGGSLVAKSYNPKTTDVKKLFTTPFREAVVNWGKNSSDTHYYYPKATYGLEGFLYQYANNKTERLPISGYGLTTIGNNDSIVYSRREGSQYKTYYYSKEISAARDFSLKTLTDKCGIAQEASELFAVCGVPINRLMENEPDRWYMGTEDYIDNFWQIDKYGNIKLLVKPLDVVGRSVDVTNPKITLDNKRLYFKNKKDGFLWVLELTD